MVLNIFLSELFHPGSFFGLPSIYIFAVLAVLEFMLCAGSWNVFRKAGKVPWHALVPGLHHYEVYDIAWDGRYGIAAFVLRILELATGPFGKNLHIRRFGIEVFITVFTMHFVLTWLMKLKLSRSFSKSSVFAFLMIFFNEICMFVIGRDDSEYLGRSRTEFERNGFRKKKNRPHDYLIDLNRTRSTYAFIASTLVCIFTFYAVVGGLTTAPSEITPERGRSLYKLFTVNSNTLAAVGAAFLVPFAIEGLRKKRFVFPKWVLMIQYSGAICTTLTMIFALTLITPALGAIAYTGMNFWLHIVCPILTLILLFSVESVNIRLSANDSMICLVPFYIYAVIYLSNVFLLGESYGGWRDIYRLIRYLPATVTTPFMFLLGLGVATLLRYIYNYLAEKRQKALTRDWPKEKDPMEVKIDILGLGRSNGLHSDAYNITIPVDILMDVSAKYDIPLRELTSAYMKGVEGGLMEKGERIHDRNDLISALIGIPEKMKD
ncbi:MAG: hypothetical protein IJ130_02760 [Solobacterium sp.]|nr:hypothetical protein [Solobacterium sp.]